LKTDIPVPADYDGDGRDDLAVWRSSQRSWYVHGIATPMRFGLAGDVPTPGGYAGSAEAQLSVYRPSTGMWYVSGQPSAALGSAGFEPLVLPYGIYQAMPQGS
jgi:hypothetical protein